MARSGITYFQVVQAAASLVDAGKNPTVDGIRAALGGTGSKSTIAPLLKRWKAEYAETVAQADTGLPTELVQAVKGVYEKVQADAARLREQQQHAHEAELHSLQQQLESLQTEHAALQEEHQARLQSLQAATVQIQRLEEARHEQAVTLAGLRSENAGLEQRLSDHSAAAAALTEQLSQARAQFEHYQEAVAQQRAEEREAAERRQNRLEQELAEARQQALAQQALLSETQAHAQHQAEENARLQKRLQATEEALAHARAAHDQAAYQLTQLTRHQHTLEQSHRAASEALAECRTGLAAADKERSLLRERLGRTENQLAALVQERVGLLQEKAVLSDQLRQHRGVSND
ncbi:MAG: DNA-binding protein [Nitrococcus mobilis]|nr:DNA-binding protein [Nitrococcus mobilis]